MKIDLWFSCYNGMGGAELLSSAGTFLLLGSPPSFGSAITAFELYAHVNTRSRTLPTLGDMKKAFRVRLKTLPRVWLLRRYRRVDIAYVCRVGDEEDFCRKMTPSESFKLFPGACREIASALQLTQKCLKKTDDFDWQAFSTHIDRQLAKLPKTVSDFTRLLKEVNQPRRRQRRPAAAKVSGRLAKNKPKFIAIDHDDHHASHVGRTAKGAQFFLTTPFVPASEDSPGREFIALYIFDRNGRLRKAYIDDLGLRPRLDDQHRRKIFERRLAALGPVSFGRIRVRPFQLKRFGVTFGLVPEPLEDEGDNWCVETQPGNYMAFFKPWNSGDYDT